MKEICALRVAICDCNEAAGRRAPRPGEGAGHSPALRAPLASASLRRHAARMLLLPMAALAVGVAALLAASGCITNKRYNPAATQPATAIDVATTQPAYWLDQPAAAQVHGEDFDRMWRACERVARDYLYALDREDYRLGLMTTKPLVSKQIFEVWRRDAGSFRETVHNSFGTLRRTVRFEFARGDDGGVTVTPKVLVERETILERRVTNVSQYRTAFSGPLAPSQESLNVEVDVPPKYWTPIDRDPAMEVKLAASVRNRLGKGA